MSGFSWGFAFVGGCAAAALCITAVIMKLFPHSWLGRLVPRLFGEPDTAPRRLLAPAVDATPRVFLTVEDTGATVSWEQVRGDIDRLVRLTDPGHGYASTVHHTWWSSTPDGHSACWCLHLPGPIKERLLRQLALLVDDLRTITVVWWEADPFKVLRTQPFEETQPR